MRRTLQSHRPATVNVGVLNLGPGISDVLQKVEREIIQQRLIDFKRFLAKLITKRPAVEDKLDVECRLQGLLNLFNFLFPKTFFLQRLVVNARGLLEGPVAECKDDNVIHFAFAIAKLRQRQRHQPVDYLEVPAAGQGLEFHQGEIGFNPGGIAIHHQADGPGRRDHRDLRVAEAVLLTQRQRFIPGRRGSFGQGGVGTFFGP